MVNACPPQSDPRLNVADFISNKDNMALAGLVVEGMEGLLEVVLNELRKQEPDTNIVKVDRDFLSDENITFARELGDYIDRKLADGKKLNLIIAGDIPVVGWNLLMEKYKGKNIQVYYCAQACRQVPLCTKLQI
ncbi:hypothetical protein PED39_06035 [Methanomassiliicoccales archaeon LGM-RCC1]|nr:hypothetical protein [Candidatus Methanomethylophilaceae archaeon]WII07149.1 hypothetical protein PED39_06035 [Methanomassiliicoccales archaeon LGM-RCC1]